MKAQSTFKTGEIVQNADLAWSHARFTDYDPVGAHPQGIAYQVTHRRSTAAVHIGGFGLKPKHMILLKLQLGCIFNGKDSFVLGNITR